jgi:ATP adenylyltransferase
MTRESEKGAPERGALWQAVLERTDRAIRCGALQKIPTRIEPVEEGGVTFLVHVVEALERKRRAGIMQRQTSLNPFLPYEENLFVAGISDTHVCLLNKFNVVEHHLLLVTREFEDQEDLLTVKDFDAMWACMAEFDGLAFYNAGTVAGASQPHKHLQQIPLPLGDGSRKTPVDAILMGVVDEARPATVPGLHFVHSVAGVRSLARLETMEAAKTTESLYKDMLQAVGRGGRPGPYNLLVTRDWMLLVPRSVEKCGSISVNALGFAGSLLVRDEQELSFVQKRGPMSILQNVAVTPKALSS